MAASNEPIDTSGMRIPHNMFRDAFGRADALIASVPPGDTARAAVIGSFYDNVIRFLQAHHEGEDELLYPVARQRRPEHVDTFDRMQGEHEAAAAADAAVKQLLADWMADPSAEKGAAVGSALADLRTVLEAHLEDEERSFLPIASTTFTVEEWGQLPGHAARTFTGDKPWLILGLNFEQMTPEERDMTLTHLPPPAVALWNGGGSATFAAYIADVRGSREAAPA